MRRGFQFGVITALATLLALTMAPRIGVALASPGSQPVAAGTVAAAFSDCSRVTAAATYRGSDFPALIGRTLGPVFEDPATLFQVDRHFCADLTGDGVQEMVVLLGCCTVSSPRPWAIFQSTPEGGVRTAFAAVRVSYVQPLRLRGTGTHSRDVVEKRAILRRADANCCPRGGYRYRFVRWNGSAFYTAERRTLRGR